MKLMAILRLATGGDFYAAVCTGQGLRHRRHCEGDKLNLGQCTRCNEKYLEFTWILAHPTPTLSLRIPQYAVWEPTVLNPAVEISMVRTPAVVCIYAPLDVGPKSGLSRLWK